MPTKKKEVKSSAFGKPGPLSVFGVGDKIKQGKQKRNCVESGGTWDNQAGKCK